VTCVLENGSSWDRPIRVAIWMATVCCCCCCCRLYSFFFSFSLAFLSVYVCIYNIYVRVCVLRVCLCFVCHYLNSFCFVAAYAWLRRLLVKDDGVVVWGVTPCMEGPSGARRMSVRMPTMSGNSYFAGELVVEVRWTCVHTHISIYTCVYVCALCTCVVVYWLCIAVWRVAIVDHMCAR
jgi:hypothetical protein